MSAWMVSKAHIDALVYLATRPNKACHGLHSVPNQTHPGEAYFDEIENEIGKRLIAENRASISHRYPDHGSNGPGEDLESDGYKFTALRRFPTAVEALKIVTCYTYQASEHPAWPESWAAKLCERLIGTLIGELPGYDAAPWGWDGKPEPGRGEVRSLLDMARGR